MDIEFKVFTLNCWGIVFISKNRKDRISAIGDALAKSNYDVVCLQEVWSSSDFNIIKGKVSSSLPYSHYFFSGVTGSGVCILSKHPIEEVFFHQWSVNGYIHKLHHGDWFGGKGVGLCKIKFGEYIVNVYSAHLHAEYNRNSDEYQAHRVLQAYDTAQFIQLTSNGADLVILAGDLNTEPGDLAYRLILGIPNLKDAFEEADDIVKDKIATNESTINSYTPPLLLKNDIQGKRIDYILYHPGARVQTCVKDYCLPLPDRVPNYSFSYSDHEAVSTSFLLKSIGSMENTANLENKRLILSEAIDVCNESIYNLSRHRILYFLLAFVFFTLFLITLVIDVPYSYSVPYNILRVLLGMCIFFMIIMATIWNCIEANAVLAGKLAMEVSLNNIKEKNL